MERIYDNKNSTCGYLRGNKIYCRKNKQLGFIYGAGFYYTNGQLAGYVDNNVVYSSLGYPIGYLNLNQYRVYDRNRQYVGHVNSTFGSLVAAAGLLLLLGGISFNNSFFF